MKSGIIVVSIANGDPDLLNMKTVKALRESDSLFLRTGKHPIVSWLNENGIHFSTLDYLYEESENFDLLNQNTAAFLIRMAKESVIVYAVSDAVTDLSVRQLLKDKPSDLSVSLIPGVSPYDMILSSSAEYLNDTTIQIISASQLINGFHYDPNISLLITELDNQLLAGEVKLFLSEMLEDEHEILFCSDYCNPVSIPFWQLDRQKFIDHKSAVIIPARGIFDRKRYVLNDLTSIMDKLRSTSGCPWDKIQTHESLRPYMIEEAWECVASIDQNDMEHLCEELGDLLFQIVFHSSISKSFDEFTINDVISFICLKMIRRHPHVFGESELKDADHVKIAWEQIKQEETGHLTVISSLDDVSSGLPSLKYTAKLLKKLSGTSILPSDPVHVINEIYYLINDLRDHSDEIKTENLGHLLLLCSELCFIKGYDSELILHQTADQLKSKLKTAEKMIIQDGKSLEYLTFEELGVYLKYVEDEIE